jgi:hypothetical protein
MNNNYWPELYKKNFKDKLDPYLGLTKSEQIFKSRAKNQSFLMVNNNINIENFGCSPFGKNLKEMELKLNFTFINHTLINNLKRFSEKFNTFKQFLNKDSCCYPRVFKTIITRNVNNSIYYDDIVDFCWNKIIKFDFYTSKNHFEFLFVIKGDNCYLDLYVNRNCIFEDVNNVDELDNNKNLGLICKNMNVKKNDLINFIENFVDF